jgi:RNA polymerase sigma-70 factor (ECF subfamily)
MAETQTNAQFPATRWSVILKAAANDSSASLVALEDLCRTYWRPLYAFLRRAGHDHHEAKDLVQGYLQRLLERGDLASVDPIRGRFRAYLLAGLRNYLVSEARRSSAQKRGGGTLTFSIDASEAEATIDTGLIHSRTPDVAFDRRWAETVLDRALDALRQRYIKLGKGELYEQLKSSLTDAENDYASLGLNLGMSTGAVAVAVHRMRGHFRELVREEVAQTVACEEDLDEEMANLLAILTG